MQNSPLQMPSHALNYLEMKLVLLGNEDHEEVNRSANKLYNINCLPVCLHLSLSLSASLYQSLTVSVSNCACLFLCLSLISLNS